MALLSLGLFFLTEIIFTHQQGEEKGLTEEYGGFVEASEIKNLQNSQTQSKLGYNM